MLCTALSPPYGWECCAARTRQRACEMTHGTRRVAPCTAHAGAPDTPGRCGSGRPRLWRGGTAETVLGWRATRVGPRTRVAAQKAEAITTAQGPGGRAGSAARCLPRWDDGARAGKRSGHVRPAVRPIGGGATGHGCPKTLSGLLTLRTRAVLGTERLPPRCVPTLPPTWYQSPGGRRQT